MANPAKGDRQEIRNRKVRTPPQVAARLQHLLPGAQAQVEAEVEDNVVSLNKGFFLLEKLRQGEATKRRDERKAKLRG